MAFNIGLTITAQNNSARPLEKLNRDLKRTEKNTKKTTKAMKGLRLALGLIAVGVLVNFGKSVVKVTGDLQLMLIRLANVEGGAKKAKIRFDELFKVFGSSPFSIDAVTDSFVRLRAAGIESELAFNAVRAGADAIAAFGGTSEELKRFSIGLQQVAGKGVLSMEELRQQIGEALPVAMRVFASETNRSISQVISEVEKGRISSQEFIESLTSGLQKSFGGFAAKLGDTVLGSIQGAKSKIQKAVADVFLGNTDVAVRMTAIIQNVGTAIAEFIKSITVDDVKEFFNTLKGGVDIIIGVGKGLIALAKIIQKVFNFIMSVVNGEGLATIGVLGVLGFMLFGPVGGLAGILGGIGLVGMGVRDLRGELNAALDPGEDTLFNRMLNFSLFSSGNMQQQFDRAKKAFNDFQKSIKGKTAGDGKKKGSLADSLFGDEEQFARIKKNLEDVSNPTKKLAPLIQGLGKSATQALKQLEGLSERTEASLAGAATFPFVKTAETTLNRLNKIMEGFDGDRKLRDTLGAMTNRTEDQTRQFEALIRELALVDILTRKIKKTITEQKSIGFANALFKANDDAAALLAKFSKLVGGSNELDTALAGVSEKFRDMEADLKKQLATQLALSKAGGFETDAVNKLRDALAQVNKERDKSLAKVREQLAMQREILKLQTQQIEVETGQKINELRTGTRGAFGTLFSSDLADEATARRAELQGSILQSREKIKQLGIEISKVENDPEKVAILERQVEATRKLQAAQMEALQNTTAAGMAARDMWLSVRDAMSSAAEDGLKNLVTGAKTFKEVQLDAMNAITDAAAKYLIELIKIHIQTLATNALGSLGGSEASGGSSGFGGIFGSLLGGLFAKGGAFNGKVKPFAKGDVISGPTMFGVAGEAGTEAIMPLTRVGGKLGVQTTGGGGDSFAITIQAIDTQSGAEFLRKNADSIVNTMRSANNLNRGTARQR